MKKDRRPVGFAILKCSSAAAAALILTILLVTPSRAQARDGSFHVDYTVKVASIDDHLFHVTADIKNLNQSRLDLALPTWTPGWYTIEDYGKNAIRFRISDSKGHPLRHSMTHKQTWSVGTAGISEIKAEFDYYANILALNQAKITPSFAFFTGTELFLMPEGHRNSPCSVTLDLPQGWKVATALESTSDPMKFTAPNYDSLVDSPTEMGDFDLTRFEAEGKPHYLVVTPSGSLPKEETSRFTEMLAEVATTDSKMFGGLPYDKYTYFYFFAPAESNASGALEHLSSHVAFARPGESPDALVATAAHEFFHLWNVKRIRPVEMWPYDYSRENETPLLWVSEGFTNYYASVALYRSGLYSRPRFISSVNGAINGVEGNEARAYISPAEASVSTWLGYDSPVAFGISYYTQGQNLAALLDLSIRHDTAGARSLDDVMRTLYRDFYQKDRGFSTEDMIGVIDQMTGHDYHKFYADYVNSVESPPYETILGYAGYAVTKSPSVAPDIGIRAASSPDGTIVRQVASGSAAAEAGILPGDVLTSIDGVEIKRRSGAAIEQLTRRIGQTVQVALRRNGKEQKIEMKVEGQQRSTYRVVEMPNPSPEQLKIREGWLAR
ncbi:MAG TPA: PDZ domain-containing protein [Blastocatellia bacterium]|nr:PDZ domain-containing protein [Blastocatellia bacterium]